jgi:hypothetical protein
MDTIEIAIIVIAVGIAKDIRGVGTAGLYFTPLGQSQRPLV